MGAPPPGTLPEELWPGGGGGGDVAKREMEKRLMPISAMVNSILKFFMILLFFIPVSPDSYRGKPDRYRMLFYKKFMAKVRFFCLNTDDIYTC